MELSTRDCPDPSDTPESSDSILMPSYQLGMKHDKIQVVRKITGWVKTKEGVGSWL